MKKIICFLCTVLCIFYAGSSFAQTNDQDVNLNADEVGYIVRVGQVAPDFSITLTDGQTVKLSSLRGKVVMLQFTASWCGVCRKEMPYIEKDIWQKHKNNDDFVLIGIDRDEPLEKVIEFGEAVGVTYPLGLDPGGDIFAQYALRNAGITRNVLINRDGEIVMLTRLFNEEEFSSLTEKIDQLLETDQLQGADQLQKTDQLPKSYMITTVVILLLSVVFFVSGKVRSDLVALCALVLLILCGILTPEEGLTGFSSSVVIMMVGLFVVGGAIFKTGLAKMISSRILNLAGTNELKLFILIMLVTAAIGAFVSNTGTVALMLPIVVSMAASGNINTSRLLMPLAFASSMGGMMTLIGTPPNLVIHEELVKAGYKGLSFFTFTPVGIVCLTVGILVLIPLSKMFLTKKTEKKDKKKKNKSLKELAGEYQLSQNLYRVEANYKSVLIGKTVQELGIAQNYHISVLEIRRKSSTSKKFFKTMSQEVAEANSVIQQEDILYILGEFENVERFANETRSELLDTHKSEGNTDGGGELEFNEIGIAEIVLMPNARLINKPVKDSGFRENYGVNILGIQRKKHYILRNLKDEKMHSGDVLLVQGNWANIARLSEDQSEWVVLGQPLAEAAKVTLNHKAPVAALIMIGMIVTMMFDFIPVAPVTAVIVAALLMVLTGCFRNVEEAYKTINWESIVLIAAMLPMSLALEKTGASEWVSNTLVSSLGGFGPYVLMAGIYFTTSLMTMFISNTATAVLLAPIAMSAAVQMDISPYPFLFAVAVAASMCFASPFSTPPNALVMGPGRYTFMDYIKVGLPLQIIMGIVMIFVLPLLFPF